MLKPPALRPGARIAIVSPASTPKPELVALGLERLRTLGYEPVVFPHALAAGPLYYAGTAMQRAADLHAAFADPTIDAVLCIRGGWGTAELLPLLGADLIRRNPKPFLGFSDHTTLHIFLAQTCGLVTFYAPMLSPDFARGDSLAHGIDLPSFTSALTQTEPWTLGPQDGLRLLRPALAAENDPWVPHSFGRSLPEGVGSDAAPAARRLTTAQGQLFGGCLTLLTESLGTPYALQPPETNSILFLEEVGTRAYQWDRMLLHLQFAGILNDHVKAIVFGDMAQCLIATGPEARQQENDLLEAALLHRLQFFEGPVAIGLQCGHVDTPNRTVPLNVQAELDLTAKPTLRFLESAVQTPSSKQHHDHPPV